MIDKHGTVIRNGDIVSVSGRFTLIAEPEVLRGKKPSELEIIKTSDRLGGEAAGGRTGNAGSSPARSILWKQLRVCDRLWSKMLERYYLILGPNYKEMIAYLVHGKNIEKIRKQFSKLDEQRKQIRMKIKERRA